MKCESAFTLTVSSITHLLPAYNIFKKDEIILDLFKLKLHSILLSLSYYLPPLLFKSQKLTLNYHQLHTIFNTQGNPHSRFLSGAVYLNTTCSKIFSEEIWHCGYWLGMVEIDQCEKVLNLRTLHCSLY